jgi:methionyl-tRNA synthetase
MSKTRGNVMDPFPLIDQYGADPFRFYCLREVSFGQDGVVSEEGFKARYNTELANDLGNLVSRTTSMIGKYRGGAVPAPPPARTPSDSPLAAEAAATAENVRSRLEDLDLSAALESAWTFVRRLNRYVEEQAPWKLAKAAVAEGTAGAPTAMIAAAALDATLWDLAEGLRLLSVILYPFVPATAAAIRQSIGLWPSGAEETSGAPAGADPSWDEARWGLLPDGLTVVTGSPLFPRIED